MTIGRVLERGQVLVPQAIRRAAGLEPGDLLAFQVTAPGHIEIIRLPRLTLEETFVRYTITEPVDGDRDWPAWEEAAAAALAAEEDDDDRSGAAGHERLYPRPYN